MDRSKALVLARSVAIAAALAALVAWSGWVRWSMLTESPFPVGIDGYYYPIQLRALLAHGMLAYPAAPLGFWLMAPLAALTDPLVGAKLGAALFGALIAVPAFGVGARLGRSRGAGLIAAALAATSAGSAFLSFEFVKNGIGLTVGLTALWLVLRAVERPVRGRIVAAIVGVVAAAGTHKMAAALVVAVAIPAALAEAVGRGKLRGRRLLYALGLMVGLAVLVLGLGLAFPERLLSPGDATLFHALWADARWDLPALATGNFTLAMGHEAAIGGVFAVLAICTLSRTVRRAAARLATRPWIARVTQDAAPARSAGERAAAWGSSGSRSRSRCRGSPSPIRRGSGSGFRIVAFVPMALCAAIVAPALELPLVIAIGLVARGTRAWAAIREGVLVAIALAIVLAMPRERTEGRVLAHPAMVAAVEGLTGRIPAGGVAIVPERHIAFMVTWYTGVPFRHVPRGGVARAALARDAAGVHRRGLAARSRADGGAARAGADPADRHAPAAPQRAGAGRRADLGVDPRSAAAGGARPLRELADDLSGRWAARAAQRAAGSSSWRSRIASCSRPRTAASASLFAVTSRVNRSESWVAVARFATSFLRSSSALRTLSSALDALAQLGGALRDVGRPCGVARRGPPPSRPSPRAAAIAAVMFSASGAGQARALEVDRRGRSRRCRAAPTVRVRGSRSSIVSTLVLPGVSGNGTR